MFYDNFIAGLSHKNAQFNITLDRDLFITSSCEHFFPRII